MPKDLKEWWENESLINRLFVQPLVDLATLPGDVYQGEVPLYDEGGNTSQELIERSTNAAGTIPLAGLGAGIRPAANTLFSGAFPETASPYTPEIMEMIKANAGVVPVKSQLPEMPKAEGLRAMSDVELQAQADALLAGFDIGDETWE